MTTTEEKWAARVSGWRGSGQTAAAFSAGRGFSAGALRHWACVLKQRGVGGTTASPAVPMLVRLARVDRAPPAPAPPPLTVEVGSARVSVPSGFDAATVQAVLGALGAGPKAGAR